jgi:hypothetical protein
MSVTHQFSTANRVSAQNRSDQYVNTKKPFYDKTLKFADLTHSEQNAFSFDKLWLK